MILETDPIVWNEVHIMVAEAEEAIRITISIVVEIIDLEITVMGNIRQAIGTMIDLITEGKLQSRLWSKE